MSSSIHALKEETEIAVSQVALKTQEAQGLDSTLAEVQGRLSRIGVAIGGGADKESLTDQLNDLENHLEELRRNVVLSKREVGEVKARKAEIVEVFQTLREEIFAALGCVPEGKQEKKEKRGESGDDNDWEKADHSEEDEEELRVQAAEIRRAVERAMEGRARDAEEKAELTSKVLALNLTLQRQAEQDAQIRIRGSVELDRLRAEKIQEEQRGQEERAHLAQALEAASRKETSLQAALSEAEHQLSEAKQALEAQKALLDEAEARAAAKHIEAEESVRKLDEFARASREVEAQRLEAEKEAQEHEVSESEMTRIELEALREKMACQQRAYENTAPELADLKLATVPIDMFQRSESKFIQVMNNVQEIVNVVQSLKIGSKEKSRIMEMLSTVSS